MARSPSAPRHCLTPTESRASARDRLPAILNLDLASISGLNLELFNHKGHQLGPTLKEDILGQGGEIMEERLSG
jgi:hypothetical protein